MNNKKIISTVISLAILICGTFILTGCGEQKPKTPEGIKLSFTSSDNETWDFYYPENAGIEVEDNSETYKILKDAEENYKITINLRENSTYRRDKDENKEYYSDSYKEFTLGGYEAYSYGGSRVLNMYTLLGEADDWFTTIEITVEPISQAGNDDTGRKFYENNEEVKSIVDSLTKAPEAN